MWKNIYSILKQQWHVHEFLALDWNLCPIFVDSSCWVRCVASTKEHINKRIAGY